ncbi:hypothetical protein B0J14DRAFT_646479 [Halenospora varia]|nr:hypothetical protein B0J14DRAFT_646479 [Halenospora varia]
MQSFNHEDNSTNEAGNLPAFSGIPDPNADFGGADTGEATDIAHLEFNWDNNIITSGCDHGNPPWDNRGFSSAAFRDGRSVNGFTTASSPHHDLSLSPVPTYECLETANIATSPNHSSMIRPFETFADTPYDQWTFPMRSAAADNSFVGNIEPHEIFNPPSGDLNGLNTTPNLSPSIQSIQQPIICQQLGCLLTFARDADRIRHETAVHGVNRGLHLCPIPGCPRSQGRSYSRPDKVKEHLWKKHDDLGYTKGR